MKVKLGVIGCGRMAQRIHIKNILKMKNSELLVLCDLNEEIARNVALKYHIDTVYTNHKDLLASDQIDAVIITTPPNSHYTIIKDAAEAGKHIFVEKPLAVSVDECKKAIEICNKNKVKLMVGFMRRFDNALIWSNEMIKNGKLGKPITINYQFNHVSTYGDYIKKTDTNLIGNIGSSPSIKENLYLFLLNHLIHHANIIQWIGGPIDRLLAISNITNFFSINVLLKFRDNYTGHIQFNSQVQTDWREELEIHGTKGSLFNQMSFPYLDTPSKVLFISRELGMCNSPLIAVNTMYEDELDHFSNCIANNTSPEPNGYHGLEAQKIIVAIEKSLKNESWINIEH